MKQIIPFMDIDEVCRKKVKIKPIIFILLFCTLLGGPALGEDQPNRVGVGLFLHRSPPEDASVKVLSVLYKSPADKAGIKPGDIILQVDGKEATGRAMTEVAEMMRGPEGSELNLTLRSKQGVTREVILQRSVLREGQDVVIPLSGQRISSVYFTKSEKDLVKAKILSLQTEEARLRMKSLLEDLKKKRLSKKEFLNMIGTEF